MPINVLHTIDVHESGGAETVFLQLISNIDRKKYNPIVLIPRDGWLCQQLKKIDIQPLFVNMSGAFNARYLWELVRIIKSYNIGLVHSHLFGSNVYCSIAGFLTRRPVISTFHGVIDVAEDERVLGLKSFLLRLGSSTVIFVSEFLTDKLQSRLHLRKEQIKVIYNGVDIEHFSSQKKTDFRDVFGIQDDEFFVALVGNVNYSKGYDVLISAVKLITDKRIKFIIAGDCSDECFVQISEELSASGLNERVVFAGFVDNVKDFIKSADLYLLCSRDEGFSIATIEAMSSNTPVIVTKCGGPEEIVDHNINGIVIENESPEQMADSITKVIANEDLRERLSQAAKETVKSRFSIGNTIKEYMCLYENLLKKR